MKKIIGFTLALGLIMAGLYGLLKPKPPYVLAAKWGIEGNLDGWLRDPTDVAVDAQGGVYVADFLNHRIQKFDSQGHFLKIIAGYGHGPGGLSFPRSLALDPAGNLYVAEQGNGR